METKANYALIGAFTIAGFLGILAFMMWFAKLSLDRQFAYYDIYFPEVSGLGVSSQVRFAGLPVGKVIDMELAPHQAGPVRVRIEVSEDTPVRSDSTASLEAQGVTGVMNVAISAGTSQAQLLREISDQPVPVIASSRSALQTLSDEGPEMISRLNAVAAQMSDLLGSENQDRVAHILTNVENSSSNLDQAMTDIAKATEAIGDAADAISAFGDKLDGITDSAQVTMTHADTALQKFTETAGNADRALDTANNALTEVQRYVSDDLRSLTTRADATLAKLDESMAMLPDTLSSAKNAFEGADRMMNTDLGPVVADLRTTLGKLNGAIDSVVDDLPVITGQLREAADSANAAFGSLRGMLDGARGPVQAFAREALPQFTRLSSELRDLTSNVNQLVTTLRRNPAQILTGPRTPEFRR